MSEWYILDESHNPQPATIEQWSKWSTAEAKRVARDEVGDSSISTVFLGLDHSFEGGWPLLFETMVFGGHLDGEMDRYYTWKEALEGHKQMVDRVKKEK